MAPSTSPATAAPWARPVPVPARAGEAERALTGRGWRTYLVVAALLAPFVLPRGPAQLAALDAVNFVALFAFAVVALGRRPRVVVPFPLPLLVVAAGSLLAVTNAVSVGASALSLAQDAYLVLWFVVLVALLSRQDDLRPFALAWTLVASGIALLVIAQAAAAGAFPGELLADEGFRPAGTFYGPNMCADYLVLSVFVALSLWGRVARPLVVGAIGLMLLGVLVTKSNGSLLSFVAGIGVATLVWVMRGEGARLRRVGVLLLLTAGVVLAAWVWTGWGGGAVSREGTVLGRMDKSSAGRFRIWNQLGTHLARHPLGIGPGNSVFQSVEIGQRQRRMSFQSKEAHSDYMAYVVERGPIGLIGHLAWIGAGLGLVLGATGRGRRLDFLRAVFAGGLVATAVHSLVIEKLHFRHYWLFVALAFAAVAAERFREPGGAER